MFKTVVSGHVTETYQYVRGIKNNIPEPEKHHGTVKEWTDEEFEKHRQRRVRLNEKSKGMKITLYAMDNKRFINVRRREKIRRLILANFTGNANMIMLTGAGGSDVRSDEEDRQVYEDVQTFLKAMKRKYKWFKYVFVAERQERGTIHFHGICNCVKRSDMMQYPHIWDYREIKKSAGVTNYGAYVIKYMTKESVDLPKNCPAYKASRNLIQPVIEYTAEQPMIARGEKVYAKSWVDYNGDLVNYVEYNNHHV